MVAAAGAGFFCFVCGAGGPGDSVFLRSGIFTVMAVSGDSCVLFDLMGNVLCSFKIAA